MQMERVPSPYFVAAMDISERTAGYPVLRLSWVSRRGQIDRRCSLLRDRRGRPFGPVCDEGARPPTGASSAFRACEGPAGQWRRRAGRLPDVTPPRLAQGAAAIAASLESGRAAATHRSRAGRSGSGQARRARKLKAESPAGPFASHGFRSSSVGFKLGPCAT